LRVYHRTEHAAPILANGFRDGYKLAVAPDEPAGVLEFRGVWVSADWPLDDSEGAHGDAVLELDIPEELFTRYEWAEEGGTYREAMIPAVDLNRHLATARRLSYDEEVELTNARWASVRHLLDERP
jgi:hypothetical protein